MNQILLERHGVNASVDPEVSDWINMDGPASGDTLRDIHRRSNGQPVIMVKKTPAVEPQLPNDTVVASQAQHISWESSHSVVLFADGESRLHVENEQHTVPDVLSGIEGPEDRIGECISSTDQSSKNTGVGSEREHELEAKITSLILENESVRRTIKMHEQILYPLHRHGGALLDAAREKLLRKYSHAIDFYPPISSEDSTSPVKKILASLDVEDRQFLDVEEIEMIIGRGQGRGIHHGSGSSEGKMIGANGSTPVLFDHLAPPQVEIYQRIHVFCYGEMAQLIV
ncbi:hypothetical protein BS47DRAFT_1489696 [Hydnum rufescens UP504]|uniref:Uncharacterized protein n=1 Tax=Hydnum rufescens UP504 TaxID=1448309 RepID=A0A9P6AH81_9AGAM|nr:hypothetical protein BS47DRAFT_1489696 [Hydnum rufescens UP504]